MQKRPFQIAQCKCFLSIIRSKATKSDIEPSVLKKLDEGFANLQSSDSKSLLKKYLTPKVFKALRLKRTKTSTLLDCIQSGLTNLDSGCGVYAADADSYNVFATLFDPIIEEYHCGFKKKSKHPAKDFGNPCVFGDPDPHKNYIGSTRIRCARSIRGYPFNPGMSKKNYDQVEDMIHCTLSCLGNEFAGVFHPLFGMKKTMQKKLIDEHLLFKADDRFLKAAKACRFWPTGRSIFCNFDKTFVVWCNEEDHIRMISMQRGGNFGEVYSRLVRGVNAIEAKIPFEHHERLGYLTFCPTNLGTTIRASVHIRVPKLASDKKKFEHIAAKHNLQIRGTRGEHTDAEGGIYDISNKRRLGLTEFRAVKGLYKGIIEIIQMEKAEKGKASSARKDTKTVEKAN